MSNNRGTNGTENNNNSVHDRGAGRRCDRENTGEMEAKMKKGDVVMIYDMPISKEKPEGEAELVRFETKLGSQLEMWKVSFKKWKGPTEVSRMILVNEK